MIQRLRRRWPDLLALLLFLSIAWLYYWRLDAWLINDDEGSYLYAAWRIGLGELPYRDFLTPQLPAFLMPGGWLMAWLGPALGPTRALAAALTLAAGLLTWASARRLFGPLVALLAGAALLLQPDVFLQGRSFRADPFMLAFAALGLYLFARAAFPRPGQIDPPDRRWLVAAGLAFGLATLSKLFGPFALAGCLAWLLVDGWRRGRAWRAILLDGLAAGLPCVLVVGAGLGLFAYIAGADLVYAAVIGHHTRQGAGTPAIQVLSSGLAFFGAFLRQNNNALLVCVALAVAATAWPARDRRALLFGWQLPTALIFLLLSREKYPRHLVYLMPALATLFALGLQGLLDGARALLLGAPDIRSAPAPGDAQSATRLRRQLPGLIGALTLALALALLLPWRLLDRDHAFRWETGTEKLADVVRLLTGPEELLFSDYSELNFYARRPTTYSAASLSAGAAGSGQITWARIEAELAGRLPPLIVLDTDAEYAHLSFLTDRPAFDAWLAEHYGPPAGFIQRDYQRYRVYAPLDRPLPTRARFAGGPSLLAAASESGQAGSGDRLELRTAWRMPEPEPGAEPEPIADLGLTLRLLDGRGREWAQGDAGLLASDGADRLRVRPTSRWRPGEISAQRLAITVPLGLPPGSYDLVLGLYRRGDDAGAAVAGLDAFDAGGQPLGQSVLVGQVRIAAWPVEADRVPASLLDLDLRQRPALPADAPLRLLGRGPLPTASVEAGRVLPLDLWWAATGPAPDRALRLTLSDAASGAVAADWVAQPGAPDALAADWPAGPLVLRQRVDLPLEPDAVGGSYRLGAVLVDAAGRSLPGAEPVDLGQVEVLTRDLRGHRFGAPSPAPAEVRSARVGDLAELLGVDLELAPDLALEVELSWRAISASAIPYRVTVQLLSDAGANPRALAQHDGDPAGGARPTTGWIRGELIRDPHRLDLPADLAPGSYPLVAAFYHPLTGARLPVSGPDAWPGDLLHLADLAIPER